MATGPFVRALLAAVLLAVGTTAREESSEALCVSTCNLKQGYCTPEGECRCYPGYAGENCDECAKAPGCVHGFCEQPFQCRCDDGWGGPKCDRDLKICERIQPCQNHATCINNGNGEYLCVCQPGFYGIQCQQYSPGGIPKPTTTTTETSTTTTTTSAAPIRDVRCENGGRCGKWDPFNQCARCICQPGYAGTYCEINVNECLILPCANGGKCFDLANDFYCQCERGFTGRYCSVDIDECSLTSDLCFNGGTCVNRYGSYECICPEGYSGNRCGDETKSTKLPGTRKPVIPLIVRITSAVELTASSVEPTTTPQRVEQALTERVKKPLLVQIPPEDVKMTRITHKLEISAINGKYSHPDNELLIRQELNGNSAGAGTSAQAMQAMTFVFMGLAIVILVAILALVWLRCFRNHREDEIGQVKERNPSLESPPTPSVISSVDNDVQSARISRYEPVNLKRMGDLAASQPLNSMGRDQDLRVNIDDEASYLQINQQRPVPGREENRQSHQAGAPYDSRQSNERCPSPPPPYPINTSDLRRSSNVRPAAGYYVALPPVTRASDISHNFQGQLKSTNSSLSIVSQQPEEVTSLLDNDSSSHRIVV